MPVLRRNIAQDMDKIREFIKKNKLPSISTIEIMALLMCSYETARRYFYRLQFEGVISPTGEVLRHD